MNKQAMMDNFFEQDENWLAKVPKRLARIRTGLYIMLGMAVTLVLLIVETVDNLQTAIPPMLLLGLLSCSFAIGLYLCFAPTWRRVAIQVRRSTIILAWTVTLTTLSSGFVMALVSDNPDAGPGITILLFLVGLGLGLVLLNNRWRHKRNEENMFV